MSESPLIDSIAAAVQSRPEDVPLRLHLVQLLLDAGRKSEAVSHAAQALQYAPDDTAARELMAKAIGAPATPPDTGKAPGTGTRLPHDPDPASRGLHQPIQDRLLGAPAD